MRRNRALAFWHLYDPSRSTDEKVRMKSFPILRSDRLNSEWKHCFEPVCRSRSREPGESWIVRVLRAFRIRTERPKKKTDEPLYTKYTALCRHSKLSILQFANGCRGRVPLAFILRVYRSVSLTTCFRSYLSSSC